MRSAATEATAAPIPTTGHVVYVDPAKGSDAGAGTQSAPLATLRTAVAKLNVLGGAGNTVLSSLFLSFHVFFWGGYEARTSTVPKKTPKKRRTPSLARQPAAHGVHHSRPIPFSFVLTHIPLFSLFSLSLSLARSDRALSDRAAPNFTGP